MKSMIAALLILGIPQEDPAEWVRKLGDDLIEVRDQAVEKLLRLGEAARESVTKAAASGDPEIRARAEAILKTLDVYRDLRGFLAPPTRITLSGEMTLEEAARDIERQSGQKISGAPWPQGKFKVDLKEVPFWKALDSVCAASGARKPSITSTAIRLEGDRYSPGFSSLEGPFCLRLSNAERSREIRFQGRSEERALSFSIQLGWERSIVPLRSYLDVKVAEDDRGFNLIPGFLEAENRVSAGGAFSAEEPKPVYCDQYHLQTKSPPDDKAKVLRTLSGFVVLWVRGAPGDVELAIPAGDEETKETIRVLDSKLQPGKEVKVTLSQARKSGTTYSATLGFEGVDPRMLKWNTQLYYAVDQKGRKYPAYAHPYGGKNTLQFSGLPEDAVFSKVVIRLPKRVVHLEIPFTLKDIPVN
jgi:hypothetical protein